MKNRVNVVMALLPEAQPLIQAWDLKPVLTEGPYRCFENDEVVLIVSGLGADLAAAACGYLYGTVAQKPAGWLNVGIGGHGHLPLGSLRMADTVVDLRGAIEFPMRLGGLPELQTSKITAYFQAEPRYPQGTICDMESAGFVAACRRLTGPEGIAVLKVVSDNAEHPAEDITPKLAFDLLNEKATEIRSVVTALLQMNATVKA